MEDLGISSIGQKRFHGYAWGLLGYNLAVVLWGAYVRATGSGAGCGSHWPLCNGELLPRTLRLETVIEMIHRLTSGVDGLLILALGVLAWGLFPRGHAVRFAALAAVALVISEALVGAGLVRLELVADNDSTARAVVMAFHLVNTFFLLASLNLTAIWAGAPEAPRLRRALAFGWLLTLALGGLLLLGISGAITALGDTLFPAHEFSFEDLSANAHFLLRLRVFHPLLAVAIGLYVALAAATTARRTSARPVRRVAALVIVLYLIQLAGGWLNVRFAAPVWMQLVHLLLADLVWLAVLALAALYAATGSRSGAYT